MALLLEQRADAQDLRRQRHLAELRGVRDADVLRVLHGLDCPPVAAADIGTDEVLRRAPDVAKSDDRQSTLS